MNTDEMTLYKWLDADEMRPRRDSSDAQASTNKLFVKILEMLISDNG